MGDNHMESKRFSQPAIDCDVHHSWVTQEDLLPYLSEGWREFILGPGRAGPLSMLPCSTGYENPHGFDRADSIPEGFSRGGSDLEHLRKDHLEPNNIQKAVLTFSKLLYVGIQPNPFLAAEVARAANDWMLERWLDKDERLAGSVLVANQLPDEAAKEIRRVGQDPRVVQVLMAGNGVGKPWGHPLFDPIYRAAEEMDLPVAIHAGGAGGIHPAASAGGEPSFYIEYHTMIMQGIMTALLTFITQGVFEKFPRLRLVLVEGGVGWIAPFLWRFDANYRGLRREVPWVKKLPSDYFREHCKVTTQPFEASADSQLMVELVRAIGGADVLLFSSDYPHWDTDDIDYIARRLPEGWLQKVMYENAAELYGFPALPRDTEIEVAKA